MTTKTLFGISGLGLTGLNKLLHSQDMERGSIECIRRPLPTTTIRSSLRKHHPSVNFCKSHNLELLVLPATRDFMLVFVKELLELMYKSLVKFINLLFCGIFHTGHINGITNDHGDGNLDTMEWVRNPKKDITSWFGRAFYLIRHREIPTAREKKKGHAKRSGDFLEEGSTDKVKQLRVACDTRCEGTKPGWPLKGFSSYQSNKWAPGKHHAPGQSEQSLFASLNTLSG